MCLTRGPLDLTARNLAAYNGCRDKAPLVVKHQVHHWNGYLYVPFHSARVSGGPFLPPSEDSVSQHLKLRPRFFGGIRDRYVGTDRIHRRELGAAQLFGNSMIDVGVLHRHIIVFEHVTADTPVHRKLVVIEKTDREERRGSWAFKRLLIKSAPLSRRNRLGDEIDWEAPVIELDSANIDFDSWRLDPEGKYRLIGELVRRLWPHDAVFENSDDIARRVAGEE